MVAFERNLQTERLISAILIIKRRAPLILFSSPFSHLSLSKKSSPHPRIISHSILKTPSSKISSTPSIEQATKSGATLTYGPFENISPIEISKDGKGDVGSGVNYVSQAKVHFVHDIPVVSIVTLDRHVEVSHWGDNLATEDRIWLRNDGPK